MCPVRHLSTRLDSAVASALVEGFCGAPVEFLRIAESAVERVRGPFPGLLACAASRWCGADPEAGLPAAVASVLLNAAVESHLSLREFGGICSDRDPADGIGAADILLAGDALIPLALEQLASGGGVHATLLLRDAVRSMAGEGVLDGLSLELDTASGERIRYPESGGAWQVHAGKLARFASQGGARLAGAPQQSLDDAARIGLCVGLAGEMVRGRPLPSRRGLSHGAVIAEASVLLDEALGLVGNGPDGELYRQLVDLVWGEDLFSGVDQG